MVELPIHFLFVARSAVFVDPSVVDDERVDRLRGDVEHPQPGLAQEQQEEQEALLQRQPQFARCLVEKLLIHALGRELTAADRPAIRTIVEQAATNGYRLRDLVLLCCESELLIQK